MSLEKSYLIDDESDNDVSVSRSSGTCAFPFCFDNYVGCVSDMGSIVFVPIGFDSNCDVVTFFVFIPIEVKSKGGQLIVIFWRPKS